MKTIDAHQHVWNLRRSPYEWITPELGPLYRSFDQEEVEPQLAAAGIDATILVQAENTYADTEHMLEVARSHASVAGVVGWVPLDEPEEAVAALRHFEEDPRFVGVRCLNHLEPDPDWLLGERVDAGLGVLEERGLPFEVVATEPRHLELVPELAARHPELPIVIDHLGKPPIASGDMQPWAGLLAAAAAAPKVSAKVSGLNTAAAPGWSAADLRPYFEQALACFGPGRLMFGGDWPVAILSGDYAAVAAATRELVAELPSADAEAIMGGTAIDVYGLEAALAAATSTEEEH